MNEQRQNEVERILNIKNDNDMLDNFTRRIKAMPQLKIDAEITHNVLRNTQKFDVDESIEKVFNDYNFTQVDHTYTSPKTKNYEKSLLGMKLIMESILNSNDHFSK